MGEDLMQLGDHIFHLFCGEFGEHGQGERLLGDAFGDGEGTGAKIQGGIGLLAVDGDGVMDAAMDSALGEFMEDLVAMRDPDGIDVVDMPGETGFDREDYMWGAGEELVIVPGMGSALGIPLGEMAQFDAEGGALEAVHTAVPAYQFMVVFFALAVIAEDADAIGEGGVGGHDGTGFTEGAEVFTGIKTEAASVAEGADTTTFVFGSMGLAGILNDREMVLAGKIQDGIHVGRLTP